MKVLSLIQVIETPKYVMELSTTINKEFIWIDGIDFDGLRDFYNQEFKPELITELFEGWTDNKLGFFTDKINNHIDFAVYGGYVIDNRVTPSAFKNPRTLDDFINDTSRAGIKLYWKSKDKNV